MTRFYRVAAKNVWIAWIVCAALVLYFGASFGQALDRALWPVVARFDVLSIKRDGDSILVAGTLIKERQCDIIALRAQDENDSRLRVDFLDRPNNADLHPRPVGPSSWGPWRVHPGAARYVTLYSEHRCHPAWTMTTPLAAFQVKPRYE